MQHCPFSLCQRNKRRVNRTSFQWNNARNHEGNAKRIRLLELYGFFSAGNPGSQAFAKTGTGSPLGASQTCLSEVLFGPFPWLQIPRGTNKANKFADPRARGGQNAWVMSVKERWWRVSVSGELASLKMAFPFNRVTGVSDFPSSCFKFALHTNYIQQWGEEQMGVHRPMSKEVDIQKQRELEFCPESAHLMDWQEQKGEEGGEEVVGSGSPSSCPGPGEPPHNKPSRYFSGLEATGLWFRSGTGIIRSLVELSKSLKEQTEVPVLFQLF